MIQLEGKLNRKIDNGQTPLVGDHNATALRSLQWTRKWLEFKLQNV